MGLKSCTTNGDFALYTVIAAWQRRDGQQRLECVSRLKDGVDWHAIKSHRACNSEDNFLVNGEASPCPPVRLMPNGAEP
jgi:hypothetical protein